MSDRSELVSRLQEAHKMTRSLAAALYAGQEVYPGWTVKEFLAHLAGWDNACVEALRYHLRGDSAAIAALHGADAYNAQTLALREGMPLERILAEWELSRYKFINMIERMPAEKYDHKIVYPWGEEGPIAVLIMDMVDHEMQHYKEISEKVKFAREMNLV